MPRALTMHRVTVPSRDREKYLEQVKRKAKHYTEASCRFWVFEETGLRGVFVEFMEADDVATLLTAHKNAPDQVLDPMPVYHQVEIA
jgi:phage gp46-like protein